MEPISKLFVPGFTLGYAQYDLNDHHIGCNEFVAASLHQQLNQVQGRTLVCIDESVIALTTP